MKGSSLARRNTDQTSSHIRRKGLVSMSEGMSRKGFPQTGLFVLRDAISPKASAVSLALI